MGGSPWRLSGLLMALTIALSWLTLMGLPEGAVLPEGFRCVAAVPENDICHKIERGRTICELMVLPL